MRAVSRKEQEVLWCSERRPQAEMQISLQRGAEGVLSDAHTFHRADAQRQVVVTWAQGAIGHLFHARQPADDAHFVILAVSDVQVAGMGVDGQAVQARQLAAERIG